MKQCSKIMLSLVKLNNLVWYSTKLCQKNKICKSFAIFSQILKNYEKLNQN